MSEVQKENKKDLEVIKIRIRQNGREVYISLNSANDLSNKFISFQSFDTTTL
jgi:hypothetical protein